MLVVFLAAIAIGMLVFAASRPAAEDLVARSQAVYDAPPAFAMTTRFEDGSEVRYLFDGTVLRMEVTTGRFMDELPTGWISLDDPQRSASYDPSSNEWIVVEEPDGQSLQRLLPNWVAPGRFDRGEPPPLITCADWRRGETIDVAGGPADEVICDADHYWIDQASGLLVKQVTADTPSVQLPAIEVVSLEIEPDLDPSLFAFEPPPGAIDPADFGGPAPSDERGHPPGRSAAVLERRAGRWQPLLDGPAPRQAVGGAGVVQLCADGHRRVPGRGAGAGCDHEHRAGRDGAACQRGGDGQVRCDDAGRGGYGLELLQDWQLVVYPVLVLVYEDGTVADVQRTTFDRPKLATTLDALAVGAPLPEPNPLPPPRVQDGRLTDLLVVGDVAPELSGVLSAEASCPSVTCAGNQRSLPSSPR